MVFWRTTALLRWKRQQSDGLEPSSLKTSLQVVRSHRSSQSCSLVSPSARSPSFRRRYCRSPHQIQKQFNRLNSRLNRYRFPSLQLSLQQDFERGSQHSWLLLQWNKHLEVPQNGESRNLARSHHACSVPDHESWRQHNCVWSWGRNPQVLECLPQQQVETRLGQQTD